jgi:pimeloyl-ACP methyl ester carboxylesterase
MTSEFEPFQIAIADEQLGDLRDRLQRTRWPDRQTDDAGWGRGVPPDYLASLAEYWQNGFDWRAQERTLNAWQQYTVSLDNQPIHLFHVKSAESEALPLLLVHGWPSSPFEFVNLLDRLTDPVKHGGAAGDAFDLVIPSLPGYGFSTPVGEPGWGNIFRVAQAFAGLMSMLGYERYAVHGTDVGSGVANILAMIDPHVVGAHIAGTVAAMPFGPPLELEGLAAPDRARAERFNEFRANGIGYLQLQATRPQALTYSLVDSPVGQLAWIVDRFWAGMGPDAATPDEAVGRNPLLTNASLYWFTRSGASTANAIYDGMQAWRAMAGASSTQEPPQPQAPLGVAVFGSDTTIRSVMDPARQIGHWSEFDRGGHFPAMETPELLIGDLRAFFAPLRDARP